MMSSRATGRELAGPLRVVWEGGIPAGVGDGPLLTRFAAGRGGDDEGAEAAFEALIGRHGPMVLRVCSGLLGDRHSAEDAFQAVFLVLARRAGSIRQPDRLAPWLHGVALRVAREARGRERRRVALDRALALASRPSPEAGSEWPGLPIARREASEALHAAIGRLPGRYREAVVLCDLEGLAVVEAADRLGCPASTLGVRLMRARRKLRDQLEGREPGLLGALPALPAGLAATTARLASRFASGGAGSALALGVLRGLRLARLKAAGTMIALAAGLAATGGWAATHGPAMAGPTAPAQVPAPSPAEPPKVDPPPPVKPIDPPVPPPAEPPTLDVARPLAREVRDYEDYNGRVEASRTVEIRARVDGTIARAEARDGGRVKAGDVLYEIDSRSVAVQREAAEAQSIQARARLIRAESELKQARRLRERAGIGQEELDRIIADEQEARALMALAESATRRAILDVEATRVLAPFDGEVSRRVAEVGATVKAGETALATLVATNPIAVVFEIDERTYLKLCRQIAAGKLAPEIPTRIALADEHDFTREGRVRLDSVTANSRSGTFRLRWEVPNADRSLIPGLSARVRIEVGPPHPALLVPESAVGINGNARYLLILDDRDVVDMHPVALGVSHGALREVRVGLAAGERYLLKPRRPPLDGTATKFREIVPREGP